MASTILYKFRSGTSFETLPLPGTSARLYDIKRAIVRAKKLDSSSSNTSLEFDLAIQNAATNETYDDESMILPRGTRVVVRRVAAERGRGILSRMAQPGGGMPMAVGGGGAPPGGGIGGAAARDGFYTIRSRDHEADDEFLDTAPPPQATPTVAVVDESKELEALRAVTDQAGSMYGPGGSSSMMPAQRGRDPRVAGQGAPPQFAKPPPFNNNNNRHRPNADPELRMQEMMNMPQTKKRATGIPRTFLNLSAPSNPPPAEGGDGNSGGEAVADQEGNLAAQLQPSAQAFQALVRSGGGQSTSSASKRRDLDYALKLTATSIPEHLQCGICHGMVRNAMLIPWDTEGRPTCESCIRDGLTKNGFTCPLTGTEGVSPDDLFPNVGLRKAAEAFIKGVMEKLDSIEQLLEAEEEEEARKRAADARMKESNNEFEDAGDGIIMGNKSNTSQKKSNGDDDDLFGGDDEFGGDVFDVAEDEPEEPDDNDDTIIEPKSASLAIDDNSRKDEESKGTSSKGENGNDNKVDSDGKTTNNDQQTNNETNFHSQNENPANDNQESKGGNGGGPASSSPTKMVESGSTTSLTHKANVRKEAMKRRGPPVGYVLGPAGGGMASPAVVGIQHQQQFPPPPPPMMMGGGGPPPHGGRGGSGPHNMSGPQFGDMSRGGGGHGGPPGGGGGGSGRFYPNQFGGRGGGGGRGYHPNQQPYPSGRGGGGPPPSQQGYNPNQGGRGGGGFHRNQQWGDNNNGNNDWNRKRPREAMLEQQQHNGSPANMYQGEPNQQHHHQGGYQQQGGWNGGGGRGRGGPPGGNYQGRGGGYNPHQFQGGRGGGGGGRFQGGRGGGGGRGYNDFRGRGGWGGRGRF